MNRDFVGWLVIAALLLTGVALFAIDHIEKVREREGLFGGVCSPSEMIEGLRSFKRALFFSALFAPVFGVLLAAGLTRRLVPELGDGQRGTGRRLMWGVVASIVGVVAFSALFYALGGQCLHNGLAPSGLPLEMVLGLSLLGRVLPMPNFWLAAALELLLATLVSFALLAAASRMLSRAWIRMRRA